MPVYKRPSRPTAFGQQQQQTGEHDRRVGLIETRKLLTVDRGQTAAVQAAGEGQLMVQGTGLWHYAQGEWRGGVDLHIKLVSDIVAVTTADYFVFVADNDMDGCRLLSAHAYVNTTEPTGAPNSAIEAAIANVTTTEYLVTSAITIDAGEWSSYTSASPAVMADVTVSVGDQLAVEVTDQGDGDGYGFGVILKFG